MKQFIYLLAIFICTKLNAQQTPQLDMATSLLIKEAFTINQQYCSNLMPGYGNVPFSMVLIQDEFEYLLYHNSPTNDFIKLEYDSLLTTTVYFRERTYPKKLLATFPAVNGINCIVVGTPANTEKTPTDWLITLLHEHFHQYQFSLPNYYDDANNLNLRNGDETGMWMLNYPFSYTDTAVIASYNKYVHALHKAVKSINTTTFNPDYIAYKQARLNFKNSLSEADYKYFSLQVWQEGIARYLEYHILKLAKNYVVNEKIASQLDYVSLQELFSKKKPLELDYLRKNKLETDQRTCFYSIGLAEGLLLEHLNPQWMSMYASSRFDIETLLK